jgi:signal transduction histidine kinase
MSIEDGMLKAVTQSWQRTVRSPNRVRVFAVLALVFALTFALTTWRTARVERQKVTFATCLFAGDASRVVQARAKAYLEAVAAPVFAGVGGRAPLPPGGSLASPYLLRKADRAVGACHCAPHVEARGYFLLTMHAGRSPGALTLVPAGRSEESQFAVTTDPDDTTPVSSLLAIDTSRIKEAVDRLAPRLSERGVVAAGITASADDQDALHAVAVLSPKFNDRGELLAVYGILVNPEVFASEVVAPHFDREPIFPNILVARALGQSAGITPPGLPNNALANLAVLDSHLTTLYQTGPMADTTRGSPGCVAMAGTDPALALLMIHISPPAQVYERWVRGSLAESYLPFLAIIIAAMLASVAAAIISARREAELAKLRSDFVMSISHELRMPLAQILMSGEMLRFGRARTEAQHDREAGSILREAKRLTGLVENALLFSRIEHRNIKVWPQTIELGPLVDEAIEGFRTLIDGASISITTAVPPDIWVYVDPQSLRQVLYNLIENAVKYGPATQEIIIGAVTSGDLASILLYVDDQGPGISPNEASAVFEPFVRSKRHRNVGIAGSGLGLAIVRHLVSQNGGKIWIEASSRGTGSRFVAELQLALDADHDDAVLQLVGHVARDF